MSTYRRSDPDGPTTQRAVEPDVQSAYTGLIDRHDLDDRICVSGAATADGRTIEAARPLCTEHRYDSAADSLDSRGLPPCASRKQPDRRRRRVINSKA